jgi:hypothetical protein
VTAAPIVRAFQVDTRRSASSNTHRARRLQRLCEWAIFDRWHVQDRLLCFDGNRCRRGDAAWLEQLHRGRQFVNYKKDMGTWWFQPTAGVSYTRTVWNSESGADGFTDGTDVRVQGGVRLGSGFDWAGIHFDQSLTVLAYDDAVISGGAGATGAPLAPTDVGKTIFGQLFDKLEVQSTSNWSINDAVNEPQAATIVAPSAAMVFI